ncbi:MAG: serine/threonine protein kinase [Deltaproteobacteria bacterium]|nr:serine/threonine protein kinase [Deltaproteobacteria bacterium]
MMGRDSDKPEDEDEQRTALIPGAPPPERVEKTLIFGSGRSGSSPGEPAAEPSEPAADAVAPRPPPDAEDHAEWETVPADTASKRTVIGSTDRTSMWEEARRAAEAPAEAYAQPGTVLADKYRLDELLGEGGMGQIYRGEHLALRLPIATKIMHPHIAANPENTRRFYREARAISVINHQNVVRVLDFGQHQSTFYIVMEFIAGTSLEDWLGPMKIPPPLAHVVDIIGQVLSALEVTHAHGIVHRDLKPQNVILTEDVAGKRLIKIVDFGLAHVDNAGDDTPSLTRSQTVAGSPKYMSPEQCRSLAVGPSTDIYAAGCVLTTLLQLVPPFEGESMMDILAKQMFVPPSPLCRPPGAEPVPPLLEALRLELLAKDPAARPQQAAEVRQRLYESVSPDAAAVQLVTRKGELPRGSRAERSPGWTTPEPAPEGARTQGEPVARVALVRQGGTSRGVDEHCTTGLEAQGVHVVSCAAVADAAAADPDVVLLDAGDDGPGARDALAALTRAAPGARAVVCLANLSTADMKELIEAGAADVAKYPLDPAKLAKKVKRLVRQRR